MRLRPARFENCLVWLAVLSLIAIAAVGGQAVTLCISNSGRVDIRPSSGACTGCPVSFCPSKPSLPVESDDLQLPGNDGCCYDVPMTFELVARVTPRNAGATGTLVVPFSLLVGNLPIEAMLASPRAIGPANDPLPHHLRQSLTCLRSVLLLI